MFLKSQKGSIISILVSIGVLGASSAALVRYMSGSVNVLHTEVAKNEQALDIHSKVINNLNRLLAESAIDKSGERQTYNRWGICSLLQPVNKSHGVSAMSLKISSNLPTQAGQETFSKERWEFFFDKSEYSLLSDDRPCNAMDSSFQSGYFSRCFQYKGAMDIGGDVYVIARIVPKKIPVFSAINLSPGETLDVKSIIFELQTMVGVQNVNNEIRSSSRYYSMIWSTDTKECHVQVDGQWTAVQFAGTGVGRLSNRLVINNALYGPNVQCESNIQFGEIRPNVIRSGHILENGSIAADHKKNARVSCKKKVYRCPGESGEDSDYIDLIEFSTSVFNDSGSMLQLNSVDFTVVDEASNEVDSSQDGKLNTLNMDVRTGGRTFLANTDLSSLVPIPAINTGSQRILFQLRDKAPGSLADLCDNVCSGSRYYPAMTMNFTNLSSSDCDYSNVYSEEENRFRCTVCHSKMCLKVGLGTFGSISTEDNIQGLTDEPLDGHIPECALKKTSTKYALPDVSDGTGNCVTLSVTGVDSFKKFVGAKYNFKNCDSSLPVLCFAFGHYLPAMVPRQNSAPTVFTGSFSSAQSACYRMGREIITRKNLAEFFKSYWPEIAGIPNASVIDNLPGDSTVFDYINNAARGIFIVPSYNVSVISDWLNKGPNSHLEKLISKYKEIWVAVEKDGGNQLIGSIPEATVADSPFAVFFRKELPSRPVLLTDTADISRTGSDTVLINNIRYKGVYNVSAGKSLRPALCKKQAGNLVLSENTSLSKAPDACRKKAAVFHPPLTSMEWVKALTMLNPNDEMYPFPNPGDLSAEDYQPSLSIPSPTAWVALSRKNIGSTAKDWRLSTVYFPENSVFRTESIPNKSDYIGLINYQGVPVRLSELHKFVGGGLWSGFKNSIHKACITTQSNGQVTILPPVSKSSSCGSKNQEVTKDILKNYLKSILFASQWVKRNQSGFYLIDSDLFEKVKEEEKRRKEEEKKKKEAEDQQVWDLNNQNKNLDSSSER